MKQSESEVLKKIKSSINRKAIMRNTPIYLIGTAVAEFNNLLGSMAQVRLDVVELSTIGSVRDFVDRHSDVESRTVVVDISKVSDNAIGVLLKYVEECKSPLIVLDRYDHAGSVFVSRMRTIIGGIKSKTSSNFGTYSMYYGKLVEAKSKGDLAQSGILALQADSPIAYVYESELRSDLLYRIKEVL